MPSHASRGAPSFPINYLSLYADFTCSVACFADVQSVGNEMDSMSRAYASQMTQADAAIDAPPQVGVDERRMQVRAYNAWSALLGDRQWPSIEDLDLASLEFGPNSILLDFTAGRHNPAMVYVGDRLREEGGLEAEARHIAEAPSGSLVSRLTDHYPDILRNSSPIGFEAEYVNGAGADILYRGILLPFSTDDESIDFVMGVINWKEVMPVAQETVLQHSVESALQAVLPPRGMDAWADGPRLSVNDNRAEAGEEASAAGMGDNLLGRLADARLFADQVHQAEGRGRNALYRAISKAWDFALEAQERPEELAALYAQAGLKVQARSPLTPVVKLIFGAQYDKTRIAEYSCVLSYAQEQRLPQGSLSAYLEVYDGGLKGLVKAVRADRRKDKTIERAPLAQWDVLRAAPSAGTIMHDAGEAEFVMLIGRTAGDGKIEVVGKASDNAPLLQRLIKASSTLL